MNEETPSAEQLSQIVGQALEAAVQLHNAGQLPEAEKIYQQILLADPDNADALHLLGLIASQDGKDDTANELITRALAIRSNFIEALGNLGVVQRRQGKAKDAIASYKKAIAIDPNFTDAHFNLGNLYKDAGKLDDAVASYKTVLAQDPDNLKAAYSMAAITDQKTEAPPDAFVTQIYDEYAGVFERKMKEGDSWLPQILRAAADRLITEGAIDGNPPFTNTLDLGCGTGRSGVEFRNISGNLHGVDLSPKMMDQARDKGVYDELFLDSFETFLGRSEDTYDLILAIDSLVYTGPLDAIFSGVAGVIRAGGAWAFTTEALSDGDFALQTTCRHAHSEQYIRRLADEHGFGVVLCNPIDNMRNDIKGTLFWLEKPA